MKLQFVVARECRRLLRAGVGFAVFVVGVIALSGCFAPPAVDLTGPRVLQASPCIGDEVVSVMPEASVSFSEAMDPFSVNQGSFAVVPWVVGGGCDALGSCPQGVCTHGQCYTDPLDDQALRELGAGDYEGGVELHAWWSDGPAGADSRLMFRPHAPLKPHTRYSVVAGAAITDQSGAGLVSDVADPKPQAWSCAFETSDIGSSGPQARLIWPPPGTVDVPTNLAEVRVVFAGEVTWGEAPRVLELEASDGQAIGLAGPELCPGVASVGETCLVLHPEQALAASTQYRPGAGTLTDGLGRPAIAPGANELGFRTATGPDHEPPDLAAIEVTQEGPCLVVDGTGSTPAQLAIQFSHYEGPVLQVLAEGGRVATRLDPMWLADEALLVSLTATDFAGQRTTTFATFPGQFVAYPWLAVTEVLGNPRGPEPSAEFVELLDLRSEGAAVDVAGLYLSDRPWSVVREAINGGEVPGDAVPTFVSTPGQRTLLVGKGFAQRGSQDPAPAPGTQVVELGSSIGDGGLANAGEPVTVYVLEPTPVLVSAYGDHLAAGGSSTNGFAMVRIDPHACDHASAWQWDWQGSTPGW